MARYEQVVVDHHTGERALIKSNDSFTLQEKVNRKIERWNNRAVRSQAKSKKEAAKAYKETKVDEATEKTEEALSQIQELKGILKHTLAVDDKIHWDSLLNKKPFRNFIPPNEPIESEFFKSVPAESFLELLWPPMRKKRIAIIKSCKDKYESSVADYKKRLNSEQEKWKAAKDQYDASQLKKNNEILELKKKFEESDTESIEKYIEMVMDKSLYPDGLEISCDIIYVIDRKTVIVDMDLPNPSVLPRVLEYKYVATKDIFTTKEMKEKDFDGFYEEVIAQISVRTLHEIFEAVYTKVVDFVTFNGWVEGIDPKTGKDFRNCIISVQAERDQFMDLKLDKVEPIQCLKGLKAQIASQFINLAPVKPILKLDRNDKRIIASEEVIDTLDSSQNLALMDWQKFEQLVRDLFAKEFSGDGVEVKVTQASRDAGVDAIVFDPDPIKGGKFVIQAKRYNNVVGVSAVRDLFGTMMNEGAVKGILVTTSTFGKDSIEFVKDKPLTLLSGAELVYLFNKHGYKVNIETQRNPGKRRSMG